MNKDEAIKRIEALEKELASVKASLEKKEPEDLLWMPGDRETYFIIDAYGIVTTCSSYDPQYTEGAASFGNIFKDASAAAKHVRRLKLINKLFRLADALNDGWVPDWRDEYQSKFFIFMDADDWQLSVSDIIGNLDINPYFKSHEVAKRAITYLTNEDKQIMRECF